MSSSSRVPVVDAARGLTVLLMFGYHATWFATDAGLASVDFRAPAWRTFQALIAGSFLFLVGVSVTLATQAGVTTSRFVRRTARIAACGLVVTLTSVVLDPARVVTFGILQCITVCSLLAWGLRRSPALAAAGGSVVLWMGAIASPRFDPPWIQWVGLGTLHPATFDFQPLVPWSGLVLLGLAAGVWMPIPRATPGVLSPLVWLGQRSLFLYMAHVPVLAGGMEVLAALHR